MKQIINKIILIGMTLFLSIPFVGFRQINNYHFFKYNPHTHSYYLVRHPQDYISTHASENTGDKIQISSSNTKQKLNHEIKLQEQTIKDLHQPPMTNHDKKLVNQLQSDINKEKREERKLKSSKVINIKKPKKKIIEKCYKDDNNNGNFWFWMWLWNNNTNMMDNQMLLDDNMTPNYYGENFYNNTETNANDDYNTDIPNATESAKTTEANEEDNAVNTNDIENADANADNDIANDTDASAIDSSNMDDQAMDASIANDDADEASEANDSASEASADDDSAEEADSAADSASSSSSASDEAASSSETSDSTSDASSGATDSAGSSDSSDAASDGGSSAGGSDGTIIFPFHFAKILL